MMLSAPTFDSKPKYTQGTGVWWSGYGMYMEWPSACFQIWYFCTTEEREASEQMYEHLTLDEIVALLDEENDDG
jgi:hypothetical protein